MLAAASVLLKRRGRSFPQGDLVSALTDTGSARFVAHAGGNSAARVLRGQGFAGEYRQRATAEVGEIIRFATGDKMAVDNHGLVLEECPGINQVIADSQ